MAASRFYSSTAGKMALVGGITGAATTIVVDTVVGLPISFPYTLMLDPGAGVEELVDVTAAGGTTLTVTRGVDGTSAQAHLNGAEVRHAYSARDFSDSRSHEANTATAHGVTGAVVGTTNVQSLTNKTALAASATTVGLIVKAAVSQTAAVLDVQDANAVSLLFVDPTGYLSTGSVVARGGSRANIDGQTLSVSASAAGVVPVVATGFAGQTADLQQWKNSAAAVLAKVDAAGKLTAAGAALTAPLTGTDATLSGNLTAANFPPIAWTAYTPAMAGHVIGNGVLVAAYSLAGKSLDLSVSLVHGSTTSWGVTDIKVELPAGMTAKRSQTVPVWMNDASTGFDWIGLGRIASGASLFNVALNGSLTASVNASRPFAWAVGDSLVLTGRIEIA